MEQPRGFGFRLGRIAVRRGRLEGMLREYCDLCRQEGRYLPHDRLAITTARRVYWTCHSYAQQAGDRRFDVCETLTRGQLDSAARLLGARLHGDRDFYARHLRGGHPTNQLREASAGRARLTTDRLLARLDELYKRQDSREIYGNTSGYVHLSPDLMELFNYGDLEHEDPEGEYYPMGPPEGVANADAWLGSARRFEDCTRLFAQVFAECLANRSNGRD